jgi:branched-chain amino acid transport system substrate-binding protein
MAFQVLMMSVGQALARASGGERIRFMKRARIIAVLCAFALVAFACGGDDDEPAGGGGGTEVTVGALFDLTGATSDVGVPYADGVKDYVEYANETGVAGDLRINLVSEDYGYDVAVAEQVYSRLTSEGAVGIQGWGTGDTEALRGKITADKLPFMSASYAETLTDPEETPYNFVVGTSYSDQMRIALQWIAGEAGGHAEVAVFHHDSPFGEAPLADGEAYIQEQGYDIGYESYAMPAEATDYVSELSRAKDQGAEYIIVQNVSTPASQLAKDVDQQGLDMQIVCLNWCGDELFIDLAGGAAQGVVAVIPFAPVAAGAAGFDEPASALDEKGGSLEDKGLHYAQGWYTMAVMVRGLAEAAESGEEITGETLKAALEEMEPVETGEVSAPVDFASDSHKGMTGSRLFQVEGGTWAAITDFLTP